MRLSVSNPVRQVTDESIITAKSSTLTLRMRPCQNNLNGCRATTKKTSLTEEHQIIQKPLGRRTSAMG